MIVCGVDEAGRGPWAGPVVAAAVVLDDPALAEEVTDSKRLSAKRREALARRIRRRCRVGVAAASVEEIDRLNIRAATWLAMQRAIERLPCRPQLALIDGLDVPPGLGMAARAIVRGDASEPAIAAASIVAKVMRDRLMRLIDRRWPGYGFAAHKGYGTRAHAEALQRLGPCPVHRKSFAPVRRAMQKG